MRSRRLRFNPVQASRRATALLVLAAALAGIAAWMREPNDLIHRPGLGYLLSVWALFIAAAGAAWKARAAELLVVFRPRRTRLEAIASIVAGLAIMLLSCAAASTAVSESDEGTVRALSEAGIVGGIAFGLAGLLTLFWTSGLEYLGNRIDQMSEDDW